MPPAPKSILLCTLGASWAVVPEILGWLAPDRLDLYADHPDRAALDALRAEHGLRAPDELWICSTEGRQTRGSLQRLAEWWRLLGAPLPLRVWTAAGTDQLATQAECDHIRELTLRVTLLASEIAANGGQLVLSLAGGRKTMSADLQSAGAMFGAAAWLHVVGPEPMPAALLGRDDEQRARLPALLAGPLPAPLAAAIQPLVAGTGSRNELLDIEIDGQQVQSRHFALPLAEPGTPCSWALPPDGAALTHELIHRQRQGSQLLGNFLARIAQAEHHENWRSLYRLPPAEISRLRQTALAPQHAGWLAGLPKADLHRHLGGCLDLSAQREVARAIWHGLERDQRERCMRAVRALLQSSEWPWGWPRGLHGAERGALTAALLLHASDAQLAHNLFGVTEPRVALRNGPRGFAAYERPGELSGSALLGRPEAIAPYARAIVAQARAEGLVYLELRGSPHKYRAADPVGFLRELRAGLQAAGARVTPAGDETVAALRIGFVWILDRRQRERVASVVATAVAARAGLYGFLRGLDLAGDEGAHDPAGLASAFEPAFADCMPLTIHAGEGESAEHIWQAAYHLHADRIGHGLTLAEHPQLAARFRDRGVCLELCPSSNREVVGYFDPEVPATRALPRYPLRRFIAGGLPVTLCTDNPGISRTTLNNEYLAAARMTDGGLSLWESLALLRQGFVHAFIGSAEREALLKHADQRTFELLCV